MNTCLFCDIIGGTTQADKVYEDKNSYAFLDIHQESPGHTLLVPKVHSRNIFDIDEETLTHLIRVTKKLSTVIKKAMDADGIRITINNEPAAGQVVFHMHIHIIPKYSTTNTDGAPHAGGT